MDGESCPQRGSSRRSEHQATGAGDPEGSTTAAAEADAATNTTTAATEGASSASSVSASASAGATTSAPSVAAAEAPTFAPKTPPTTASANTSADSHPDTHHAQQPTSSQCPEPHHPRRQQLREPTAPEPCHVPADPPPVDHHLPEAAEGAAAHQRAAPQESRQCPGEQPAEHLLRAAAATSGVQVLGTARHAGHRQVLAAQRERPLAEEVRPATKTPLRPECVPESSGQQAGQLHDHQHHCFHHHHGGAAAAAASDQAEHCRDTGDAAAASAARGRDPPQHRVQQRERLHVAEQTPPGGGLPPAAVGRVAGESAEQVRLLEPDLPAATADPARTAVVQPARISGRRGAEEDQVGALAGSAQAVRGRHRQGPDQREAEDSGGLLLRPEVPQQPGGGAPADDDHVPEIGHKSDQDEREAVGGRPQVPQLPDQLEW